MKWQQNNKAGSLNHGSSRHAEKRFRSVCDRRLHTADRAYPVHRPSPRASLAGIPARSATQPDTVARSPTPATPTPKASPTDRAHPAPYAPGHCPGKGLCPLDPRKERGPLTPPDCAAVRGSARAEYRPRSANVTPAARHTPHRGRGNSFREKSGGSRIRRPQTVGQAGYKIRRGHTDAANATAKPAPPTAGRAPSGLNT